MKTSQYILRYTASLTTLLGAYMAMTFTVWAVCAPTASVSCSSPAEAVCHENAYECRTNNYSGYSYSWYSAPYGKCSKICGSGTQVREVFCVRSDGLQVPDVKCAGVKPAISQTCNTMSCPAATCENPPLSGLQNLGFRLRERGTLFPVAIEPTNSKCSPLRINVGLNYSVSLLPLDTNTDMAQDDSEALKTRIRTTLGIFSLAKYSAPANGQCGNNATFHSHSTTAYPSVETPGTAKYCAVGRPTQNPPAFPARGTSVTWRCDGINWGAQSAVCTAAHNLDGTCGSAANTDPARATYDYPAQSATNIYCTNGRYIKNETAGTSSNGRVYDEVVDDNVFKWNCGPSYGGQNPECSAPRRRDAFCNNTARYTYSEYSRCAPGTETVVDSTATDDTYNWTCAGINQWVNAPACSAPRKHDGVCGSKAGSYSYTQATWSPGSTACVYPVTPQPNPSYPGQGGTSSWICPGKNGGLDASCSASRSSPPPPPPPPSGP